MVPALGSGFTVIVVVAVEVLHTLVPVTVYVVVTVGLAATLAPVVDESPIDGDQINDTPPVPAEAVSVVGVPKQMLVLALAVTVGVLTTVIVTATVLLQLLASVPVTV